MLLCLGFRSHSETLPDLEGSLHCMLCPPIISSGSRTSVIKALAKYWHSVHDLEQAWDVNVCGEKLALGADF